MVYILLKLNYVNFYERKKNILKLFILKLLAFKNIKNSFYTNKTILFQRKIQTKKSIRWKKIFSDKYTNIQSLQLTGKTSQY